MAKADSNKPIHSFVVFLCDFIFYFANNIFLYNSVTKMACNIVFIQQCGIFASPVAQLQLPDLPNFINYVGGVLPGGNLQSSLSANFTPNQVIGGSGIPTNPSTTGTAGAFSVIGSTLSKIGLGLGSSLGLAVKGLTNAVGMLVSGVFENGRVNTNVAVYDSTLTG